MADKRILVWDSSGTMTNSLPERFKTKFAKNFYKLFGIKQWQLAIHKETSTV
jgi:hypothetical protein